MKKIICRSLLIVTFIVSIYGLGRLYFYLTAGFTIKNITSDFSFQPQWEVRSLQEVELKAFLDAVNQPYSYFGKGCQSYVFVSQDGKYVIKFFKYQHFRLQPWLKYFPPLPAIAKFRNEKREKKWKLFNEFFQSWKAAFENLKEETGLIFVHLNKTENLNQHVTLYDNVRKKHVVDLDQMEFCIQRRANLLCETLLNYKNNHDLSEAKKLIHTLIQMILSEYQRGFADNDHALMQNTGVAEGKPVHIDVGQFVFNEAIKQPVKFHQELFTKTYKFKHWLQENYPELGEYLETELKHIIGPAYASMQPKFRKK